LWRVDSLKTPTRIVAQPTRPGDENLCVAGCTTKAAVLMSRKSRTWLPSVRESRNPQPAPGSAPAGGM
jgi:hypothetical protein